VGEADRELVVEELGRQEELGWCFGWELGSGGWRSLG